MIQDPMAQNAVMRQTALRSDSDFAFSTCAFSQCIGVPALSSVSLAKRAMSTNLSLLWVWMWALHNILCQPRKNSNKIVVINIVLLQRHSTHFASWAGEVAGASLPSMEAVVAGLSFLSLHPH